MAKPTTKKQKVGYSLSINRTGETGVKFWEQVGYVFGSTYEARRYKLNNFPDVKKSRIIGVRVNVEPVNARAERG